MGRLLQRGAPGYAISYNTATRRGVGGRAGGRSVGRSVARARACDSTWRLPSGHWVVADLFVAAGVRAHLRSDDTGQQRGQT